jgi:hypothetical protein
MGDEASLQMMARGKSRSQVDVERTYPLPHIMQVREQLRVILADRCK